MCEEQSSVVMITGGAQGIGKGIAAYLLFVSTDVTDERAVKNAVHRTLERFNRLDGLVNNAGIASPGSTPLEELSLSAWEKIISTNLSAYFLCANIRFPFCEKPMGRS